MSDANKNPKGFVDSNGNTITMSDNCSSTDIFIGGNGVKAATVKPKFKDLQEWVDRIEKRLLECKKTTSVLEKALENLNSFFFTEGDVVVSKSHGTGIVSDIGVGNDRPSVIDNEFPGSFYVVIATKNGFVKVPPDDIMPYTRASKVLHERG